MSPTLVSLSSGDTFYVQADSDAVADALKGNGLHRIGSRQVNGGQVAQLQPVREVPSIHIPEQLEDD